MDYQALNIAAAQVIVFMEDNPLPAASVDVLTSIKNQMVFIRDAAAAGKDPAAELPSVTKFTYAVLASRELASPEELLLQAKIDKVTRTLIKA